MLKEGFSEVVLITFMPSKSEREYRFLIIIAPSFEELVLNDISGCSAARLAHHVRDVEVGCSNHLTPTSAAFFYRGRSFFLIWFCCILSCGLVGAGPDIRL